LICLGLTGNVVGACVMGGVKAGSIWATPPIVFFVNEVVSMPSILSGFRGLEQAGSFATHLVIDNPEPARYLWN